MNREILFRGKRKDNGEWVEGYLIPQDWNTKYFIGNIRGMDLDEIIPKTRGQYTGLRDKNGTKIFEGDIVRVYLENSAPFPTLFVVKIGKYLDVDTGDYAIGVYLDNGKQQVNILSGEGNTYFEIEIVGNIHDNPELLGGRNNNVPGIHRGSQRKGERRLNENRTRKGMPYF